MPISRTIRPGQRLTTGPEQNDHHLTAIGCGLALLLMGQVAAAETALTGSNIPWRAFLMLGPKVMAEGDSRRILDVRTRDVWKGVAFDPGGTNIAHFLPLFSRLPDARWAEAGYDDAHWALPTPVNMAHVMAVPVVVRIDGEAVLITVGGEKYAPGRGDELIRIRDGRNVGFLPESVGGKHGATGPAVVGDIVVAGHTETLREACVGWQLSWDADRSALRCTERWRLAKGSPNAWFRDSAWHEGTLFGPSCLDFASGRMLAQPRFVGVPATSFCDYGNLLIGPDLCFWDRLGVSKAAKGDDEPGLTSSDAGRVATFVFFDRGSGKEVGRGFLPINPVDGADRKQKLGEEKARDCWRWLGAGSPWPEGNRLYIRSYDYLWCIGEK